MPTAADNAIWTIYVYGKEAGCWNYDLFTNGDTVINNHEYVVLGKRGENLPWYSLGIGSGYCTHGIGSNGLPAWNSIQRKAYAYREDSTHKVYRRTLFGWSGDTTEVLLFDFALQVGDSLKGYFYDNMFAPWGYDPTVATIDSIFIENNWRRKINFKGYNGEAGCFYFIEGIGSNYGFIDWTDCPFFESSVELVCHTVNDSIIYPTNTFGCSNFSYITDNKELFIDAGNSFIYPNPASDYLRIDMPGNTKPTVISIYNLTGQLISKKNIVSSTIPITELDNGMYVFVIEDRDKVLGRQRVIVAK